MPRPPVNSQSKSKGPGRPGVDPGKFRRLYSIRVESEVLEQLEQKGVNISQACNDFLKRKAKEIERRMTAA